MKRLSAEELITKAKIDLIFNHPFFSTLVLMLEFREDNRVETAATDGKFLLYNKAFIESLSLDETKGVLAHEVTHNGNGHHTRRGNRNPIKFNEAADLAINPILLEAGFKLPAGHLYERKYVGMYAEQIYNLLPDPPRRNGKNGMYRVVDIGRCGAVEDAPCASEAERREMEERWKIAVAQAYEAARRRGKLPAGLERMVQNILSPTLDWRTILRNFVEESLSSDYCWVPPNRKFVYQRLYLPSLQSEEEVNVVIGLDTSGSIEQELLDEFASEISSLLHQCQASADVVHCDSEVEHVEHFSHHDLPLKLHPKGGGGTDMGKIMEWIEEKQLHPKCLIIFTDLETPFPRTVPSYPGIIAEE